MPAKIGLLLLTLCVLASLPLAAATLRANAVTVPPVIDGDLGDACWAAAGAADGFLVDGPDTPAPHATIVYAASDREHLYLAFRCAEPSPERLRAEVTRTNAEIWGDDCLEFNFDPTGAGRGIVQVKVNAIGTRQFMRPGVGPLDPRPLQAAARVGAKEWTAEVALPFASLGITRAPGVGMRWQANIERLRTAGGEEEGYTWRPLRGQWDNPTHYGDLVFPGDLEIVGVGYPKMQVGVPAQARLRLANHAAEPKDLLVLADGGHARLLEVPARGRATTDLRFTPAASGMAPCRVAVWEAGTRRLLYSLHREEQVMPAMSVEVLYHARQLAADIDTAPWGRLPQGAAVQVSLLAGDRTLLTAPARLEGDAASAVLPVGDLAPGRYTLQAVATAGSRRIGAPLAETVTWPTPPAADLPAGARVLNNFVTELLAAAPGDRVTFTNPRVGWVYLAIETEGTGQARLSLDGAAEPILTAEGGQRGETMRHLARGKHTVSISGRARVTRLVVRAVPALVYCQFQADPHIAPYGPYDWEFLSRYVLGNCNTIIAGADPSYRPVAERWRAQGGQWIVSTGVPGLRDNETVTADGAEEYWGQGFGMRQPFCDGSIADEFFGRDDPKYAAWTEAVRRMAADPALADRTFIPWCGAMHTGEASREFAEVIMRRGWPLAWECYLREAPTPAEARARLDQTITREIGEWRAAQPEVVSHLILTLGYLSAPPESLDADPGVDYKVWMDMQFRRLANHPAFAGLYGVMEYLSSYADEEYVRWAGRLYRHYCIEGRTDPMTDDPYVLAHLANPDFAQGLTGWEVKPAEKGSVSTGEFQGLGWLEGRYPRSAQGDAYMLMRRSNRAPNVVSQQIKGLTPGRLYSLRLFTADVKDMSERTQHAFSIALEGVEVLAEPGFDYPFPSCYDHNVGPYTREHPAYINYHYRVFRALAPTATLTLSDWATPGAPGGPAGQELAVNFVQVQPYEAR